MSRNIKVNGKRYLVFDQDYYNSSGGVHDLRLITDDFDEAEVLVNERLKNKYYPNEMAIFDIEESKTYNYPS